MEIVNIHEAKTHLSRLVEKAARGESFVIAKAGKPMVRVSALDTPATEQRQRIGFLKGRIEVPADFDEMGREQIIRMFEEKIARMQALVDEAAASGDGQRSMEEIEQEARARLSAG